MRIAFIDLLFSWPPHGGADVDVYYVADALQRQGHDLCLFVARDEAAWERGQFDERQLPFSTVPLVFPPGGMTAARTTAHVRDALAAWRPDAVVLTEGYFLKTSLMLELRAYPVISRCYAHETACHRDILRFRDGAPCPNAYALTPDECRRCALDHLAPELKSGRRRLWTQEYLAVGAWSRGYYSRFVEAMRSLFAVIVTTEHMREQAAPLCDRVAVIPNGIDSERFKPASGGLEREAPVILLPGRVEDPAKGFQLLLEAGEMLAADQCRFEVHATLPEGRLGPPWLKSVGKLDFDAMPTAYQAADICAAPSIWEEPFGLVALEAMASGVPVVAARTGGLQDIVVHEETGLLFQRGDASSLAVCLKRLINAPELRRAMGLAGRERCLERYQWDAIVADGYGALLEDVPRWEPR